MRQNFSQAQKDQAFHYNALSLCKGEDGIEIAESYRHLIGHIYFCENCLFCHTDRRYFNVDHLAPDRLLRGTGRPSAIAINAVLLCTSLQRGDGGCNQAKGAKPFVPVTRGLAYTHREEDMNYIPLQERPFSYAKNW
ncbi:hypothetical protein [Catalinimonas niigatensis]|uniref:hypothetical protein n=1 Tax=Catalinimonas niigatensis TaxID=1397264 RepID=UPI0026669B35|nr:hypothetical protein [Catalinimonas niigatensis]WPP49120.1 hypothetical protein PZB72_20855 [Catalinimonas niigatensis]